MVSFGYRLASVKHILGALLLQQRFPETVFTETEVWNPDGFRARLSVTSVNTGISYMCDINGDYFECTATSNILWTRFWGVGGGGARGICPVGSMLRWLDFSC